MSPTTLTIEGIELAVVDDEPKVLDIDLGAHLGLAQPRDIRKLIKRYIKSGDLLDVEVCATVAQTSGGRPGQEFRLTEEQALFVIAKSETPKANEITRKMIRVFTLARKGLLAPPAPDPSLVARLTALEASQAQTTAMLTALPGTMAATLAEVLRPLVAGSLPVGGPCIGRGGAISVSGALKMYGDLMASREGLSAGQWARKGETDLRAMVHWTGTGSAWASFPMARWPELKKAIETLHATAGLVASDRQRSAQLPLPVNPG